MGVETRSPSHLYVCDGNKPGGCCSTSLCLLRDYPRNVPKRDNNEDSTVEAPTSSNKGKTPLKSEPASSETSETEAPSSTTETAPLPSDTKTDSGVTHTIPNSSIVTITKHTVVFSEAPSPSSASLPETSSRTGLGTTCSGCNEPSQTTAVEDARNETGIAPGAIAGLAAGGAVIIALVVIIWVVSRRRKRERESAGTSDEVTTGSSRVDGYEKVTPHNTGTGEFADPFAPFGGRADQPFGPYPPQSEAFEMDGTGVGAAELPANNVSEAPDTGAASSDDIVSPVTPTAAADPRATLAAGSGQGQLHYVNQWNQYKAMAEGDAQSKE
ncbi:hypothetical protein NOR_01250 [Metarhizium rileyi]|uniref:Uncharacterized protein n=1 Tax=Metarhizium rileyi (strain RCEF 4871) TaxID=1649241 RepID=A0A167IQG5_METRR|nr:hypothetical protein NOR_01250 [Metarhizium rileyi RCEF 4871]